MTALAANYLAFVQHASNQAMAESASQAFDASNPRL
jgi:hypothetical protein